MYRSPAILFLFQLVVRLALVILFLLGAQGIRGRGIAFGNVAVIIAGCGGL